MRKRQWQGALITLAFVVAFVAAVLLHLFTVAVCILLGGVTVAYILGIAWMQTRPHPHAHSGRHTPRPR